MQLCCIWICGFAQMQLSCVKVFLSLANRHLSFPSLIFPQTKSDIAVGFHIWLLSAYRFKGLPYIAYSIDSDFRRFCGLLSGFLSVQLMKVFSAQNFTDSAAFRYLCSFVAPYDFTNNQCRFWSDLHLLFDKCTGQFVICVGPRAIPVFSGCEKKIYFFVAFLICSM